MYTSFKMQKCQHLEDALSLKTPKVHGDYIITPKLDGWYCTIYYNGTKFFAPRSSANRIIPSLEWVANELNDKKLNHTKPFFIIAEAHLEDTPFEILNGIFNRSKGDYWALDAVFKVHDIVPLGIAMTAIDRLIFAQDALLHINKLFMQYVIPLSIGVYHQKIWEMYRDKAIENGEEGIIAKRAGSFYQYGKRNADLLKDKLSCTIDALAVELVEAIGEKGNNSLTLISRRANGTLIPTVINKHSDQQLFRLDASNIIGKVVEIGGMSEYEDGTIRQPVFRWIRHDKSPEDIN